MSLGSIEDFGEKFGGAKKDTVVFNADKNAVSKSKITKQSLWPKPSFRKDACFCEVSPQHAVIFMLVYEALPQKNIGHKFLSELSDQEWDNAFIKIIGFWKERYENGDYQEIEELTKDYLSFLDDSFPRGRASEYACAALRVIGKIKYHPTYLTLNRRVRLTSLVAMGWVAEAAIYDNESFGVAEVNVRGYRELRWAIVECKTEKKAQLVKGSFNHDTYKTKEEAFEALKEFMQPIIEQRKEDASLKGKLKGPHKRPLLTESIKRVGKDYRKGQPVPLEYFAKRFKFRGVEFGNWVTQKERQAFLDSTYDAFMDLTSLFGLPPSFASLGGRLGIAFGSRGRSGASAHFERGKWLIHLTKTSGVGALAHEFGHALDAYIAQRNKQGSHFASDRVFNNCRSKSSEFEIYDFEDAPSQFLDLVKAIKFKHSTYPTDLFANSKALDAGRYKGYWATPTELFARCFEVWVQDSLSNQDSVNDFLVFGTKHGASAWNVSVTQYPQKEEREIIVRKMQDWISAIVRNWLSGVRKQ